TGSLCLSQDTKAGYTLDRVPTHHRAHTHSVIHYGQFRDANQPTMHVFGPGEETGVPGGNPRGTGRTCKLHTHSREKLCAEFSLRISTMDSSCNTDRFKYRLKNRLKNRCTLFMLPYRVCVTDKGDTGDTGDTGVSKSQPVTLDPQPDEDLRACLLSKNLETLRLTTLVLQLRSHGNRPQ
ncbi:hypothetical protein QTP86_028000, partial [Hemibagrus guttatus]